MSVDMAVERFGTEDYVCVCVCVFTCQEARYRNILKGGGYLDGKVCVCVCSGSGSESGSVGTVG